MIVFLYRKEEFMYPSIKIINREISTYSIMALIGILASLLYIIIKCKKEKINDNNIIKVLLLSMIGVILGAHLLYATTQYKLIIILIKNFKAIFEKKYLFTFLINIFGGSVFYGGLIGGLITSDIIIKKNKLNKQYIIRIATPIIPLFHFFGRIGCFLVGCCYGIESKIGLTYTHSANEIADGVSRFPIQLVESLFNLLLFILLNHLSKKEKYNKYLLNIYLIIYPIGRFILEFFRGDSYRGIILGLSTSQIISIILLTFSIINIITKRKKIKQ